MFDCRSRSLTGALKRLSGHGPITEASIIQIMGFVWRSLHLADGAGLVALHSYQPW